ncbi:hypothetical protein GDO81_022557, partial [Engystomops pustulosus]
ISKCLLMKKESLPTKAGRRVKPEGALIDNDGLYNPDCDNGTFKARQCNNTDTCWCVNSAGVRRTEKGDKNKMCPELVRTKLLCLPYSWVIVQMKRNNTDQVSEADLKQALRTTITSRYGLPDKYIDNIEFEEDYIFIDLKQNSSQKAANPDDVDIVDVAYYMEKDVKGMNLMHADTPFKIPINSKNFLGDPLIMYIDENLMSFP